MHLVPAILRHAKAQKHAFYVPGHKVSQCFCFRYCEKYVIAVFAHKLAFSPGHAPSLTFGTGAAVMLQGNKRASHLLHKLMQETSISGDLTELDGAHIVDRSARETHVTVHPRHVVQV